MRKDLLGSIKEKVTMIPMELLDSSNVVIGKVAFYYDTDYLPLSEVRFVFFHLEEISLKSVIQYPNLNFEQCYWVKTRQGLEDDFYLGDINDLVLRNRIVKKPLCQREGRLYDAMENNIYTVSYRKEYFKNKINLKLFYLEEFGFEWVESFKDDTLSFTLVRNIKRS